MARVIAIANQKGGVAKTTTAITVAAALVESGHRVLLIDLDPQACASFALGVDPEELKRDESMALVLDRVDGRNLGESMRKAIRRTDDGVHLIPAAMELASADLALADRAGRERIVGRALESIRDDFDFILFDCSPSLGLMTINAL
ncbi:MAG: AAA family ATPase, partial [Candidatus Nanopelagicales bacterium]